MLSGEDVSEVLKTAQSGDLGARLMSLFGGVPNPHGDFGARHDLAPIRGVVVTQFGYVVTGANPLLRITAPFPQGCAEVRVAIQFTSYRGPLVPRILFDCGDGFDQDSAREGELRLVSSGRYEGRYRLRGDEIAMALVPGHEQCIFSIHDLSMAPLSLAEAAACDTDATPRKYGILVLPIIDWNFRFQRPQQIASQFAAHGHDVLYATTTFSGLAHSQVSATPLANRITQIALPGNDRLNIYKDVASAGTVRAAVNGIARYCEEAGLDSMVVVVNLPFWTPFAEALRERFGWPIVYDCMDDHGGFENNTPAMLDLEHRLLSTSDLVLTSSQVLHTTIGPKARRCELVRNAGEPEFFEQLPQRASSPLAHLQGPVIGYYGALAEWFDVEAVANAARNRPDWNFVFIGHVTTDAVRSLESLPNVRFCGEQPYADLPMWVAGFDVCTIPFKRIPLTEATNPVKMYEYFATGKPVVARRLPEIETHSDCAYLYDSPEQYLAQLSEALLEVSHGVQERERSECRRAVARSNTWLDRYHRCAASFDALFGKVAIIVISYQGLPFLRTCVETVLKNTEYPNFELVIVDNGSREPVCEYLRTVQTLDDRIKVILNGENRGFAAANNQGFRAAPDAEFFVLLNNDTAVPPGWLTRLVRHAGRSDFGMVGPVTNCIGNEAQIPTAYATLDEMVEFSRHIRRMFEDEYFDIKLLAMFCVAIRKEVFERVGFLEEAFTIGMFEDDDYAERVRLAGYRVVCVEDVFVHHYGSSSFKKLPPDQYKRLFETNKKIFEQKWGKAWVPHTYRKRGG